MTNGDAVRKMSNEELVELYVSKTWQGAVSYCDYECKYPDYDCDICPNTLAEWLGMECENAIKRVE